MKIQLSFLKGISIICLSLVISFFNCSSDVDIQTVEMPPPLTDVLTFELSFGDEETITDEEFLLARPAGLAVSSEGDIVVSDEARLKIYDMNGIPKRIVGNYGQGPGEFDAYPFPTIGYSGFLAALEKMPEPRIIHIFSNDYKYIRRINMLNYAKIYNLLAQDKVSFSGVNYAAILNENELVYSVSARLRSRGASTFDYNYLVYDTGDTVIVLAQYISQGQYLDAATGRGINRPFSGSIKWAELPDRKVVYAHTEFDESVEEGNFTYTLTVASLDDFTTEPIIQRYAPLAIPDSVKSQYDEIWDEEIEEILKIRQEHVRNTTYYHHIYRLITDGNYIFVFTTRKNNLGHTLVEVIDAETKQRTGMAYFPFTQGVIKNGYAYQLKQGLDIFPVVEKYKINPAMYGK